MTGCVRSTDWLLLRGSLLEPFQFVTGYPPERLFRCLALEGGSQFSEVQRNRVGGDQPEFCEKLRHRHLENDFVGEGYGQRWNGFGPLVPGDLPFVLVAH